MVPTKRVNIAAVDRDLKAADRDLNLLERFEFSSKICAAMLALTYVSGYLIATTSLGRFGISADASDLLRAKYIYIGFLYWMFVAIFGVLGRTIGLLLGAIKASEAVDPDEKKKAINILEGGSLDTGGPNQRWRPLRRWTVLALVLLPFALQTTFLDPDNVYQYVSLQSILLLGIALYQTAFYREYSKDGYLWGSLYGRWYVERIKTIYGVIPGFVAALLMAGRAVGPWVFSDHTNAFISSILFVIRRGYFLVDAIRSSYVFWILGGVLIVFLSFAALFVTLSTENLQWLEKNGRAQGSKSSFAWRSILFLCDCVFLIVHAAHVFVIAKDENGEESAKRQWRTTLDCFAFPLITGIYCYLALTVLRDDRPDFNARLLSLGTLILSLVVISNLLIILAMRRDLSVALELKLKHDHGEFGFLDRSDAWSVRALMIGVLYIVSVLGFAYRIYPFIPAQKAGGNYSTADAVTVHLTQVSSECSSEDLKKEIPESRPYIVLSEDANWIYFAPLSGPGSGGGPDCWKWGAFCSSPADKAARPTGTPYRPTVYSVNRRCIASTVSVNPDQLSDGPLD